MSLQNTISKAVDTAFLSVGNLKTKAVVTQRNVSGWDVALGQPIENPQTTTVEVIVLSKTTSDKGVVTADLLFKASQLTVDLSSVFTIGGEVFRIIPPVENNGFVVQLKAKKEQ
jgi:hypothetical protein